MSASLDPPAGRARGPYRWLALAFAAGAAGMIAAVLLVPSLAPVVVENAAFEYDTPPTTFCPFVFTIGGPPPAFETPRGATFVVSWQIGCELTGDANSTPTDRYQIDAVSSQTLGFSVVGSNVPVTFGYAEVGVLTVTVKAPSWPDIADLSLLVAGGPVNASVPR